jgi:hypothetical protein
VIHFAFKETRPPVSDPVGGPAEKAEYVVSVDLPFIGHGSRAWWEWDGYRGHLVLSSLLDFWS